MNLCACVRLCVCVYVCACVRATVCVAGAIVKRPALPPCVVDGRYSNPLYYYCYWSFSHRRALLGSTGATLKGDEESK